VPEAYSGWANRETWAVALHINNDQGWQESVLEALRDTMGELSHNAARSGATDAEMATLAQSAEAVAEAAEIIRENVEDTLETLWEFRSDELRNILTDFGSLWRVDWTQLGAAFLEDLEG
jgi:hypothetical protein